MTEDDEKDLKELQNILRPHGMDATLTGGPDPRVPPPLTGKERIEGSQVLDLTTGKYLRRVAADPGPEEYTLDEKGTFTFSPSICGTKDRPGHEIHITYDQVGPRVTWMNVQKKVRP